MAVQALRAEHEHVLVEQASLRERVAELEARLGKNSLNSSRPHGQPAAASADPPWTPPPAATKRQPSGRKPGGQPGHVATAALRASARELLPLEQVDQVVAVWPEQCQHCGVALPPCPDLVAAPPERHQHPQVGTRELPPVQVTVTEYQMQRVRCPGCGEETRAALPDGVRVPSGRWWRASLQPGTRRGMIPLPGSNSPRRCRPSRTSSARCSRRAKRAPAPRRRASVALYLASGRTYGPSSPSPASNPPTMPPNAHGRPAGVGVQPSSGANKVWGPRPTPAASSSPACSPSLGYPLAGAASNSSVHSSTTSPPSAPHSTPASLSLLCSLAPRDRVPTWGRSSTLMISRFTLWRWACSCSRPASWRNWPGPT